MHLLSKRMKLIHCMVVKIWTCEKHYQSVISSTHTVMILNFWTDRSGQTMQTQIRLLLEEQSDQGLHCLLFHFHVFDKILSGLASLFEC